jgi:hypothetical protein
VAAIQTYQHFQETEGAGCNYSLPALSLWALNIIWDFCYLQVTPALILILVN